MNTNDNNTNKNILPMNDYLAMNEEYREYKRAWDKKNNKDLFLGVLGGFLLIGIVMYIGVVTWWSILSIILLIASIIIFGWYMASKESKNKQELEEYGAKLYKEYLENN